MNILDRSIAFFEKYIFGVLLVLSGVGVFILAMGGETSFWYYILGPILVGWGLYLIFSKRK